jgi:hypothetical protein
VQCQRRGAAQRHAPAAAGGQVCKQQGGMRSER